MQTRFLAFPLGNAFKVDGVLCKSMEGFLQSLKYQDAMKQRQICSMKEGRAKHQGTDLWKVSQQVYWRDMDSALVDW